ncbi:hypothetical protein FBT96_03995 [Rhodobacter capsulatus]|uniref:Uncharacterized protein n=2 Tax=Rhodobacter capsulatus TaxID=1061 RepID=A0A4U1JZX4_RHOCA|nr:hypothetical protein FBT96_03995 [Rhodobacter capsulatus]
MMSVAAYSWQAADTPEARRAGELMSLVLPIVREGGPPKVRLSDVPEALRAEFENWMNGKTTPAEGVYAHDWYQFRQSVANRALHDAQRVARALAEAGPSATDLNAAPVLHEWIGLRDTRFGGAILMGRPEGHPVCRGPVSHTSRLCGLDPGLIWARTMTRWYRLGAPADPHEVLDYIHRHGIPRDLILSVDTLWTDQSWL